MGFLKRAFGFTAKQQVTGGHAKEEIETQAGRVSSAMRANGPTKYRVAHNHIIMIMIYRGQ